MHAHSTGDTSKDARQSDGLTGRSVPGTRRAGQDQGFPSRAHGCGGPCGTHGRSKETEGGASLLHEGSVGLSMGD